jgi:hypothetical protein
MPRGYNADVELIKPIENVPRKKLSESEGI